MKEKNITIVMNIEKWFDGNNAFDFSAYPMGIMQSQPGMHYAVSNGENAFSIPITIEK